jgi:hypothetical protein
LELRQNLIKNVAIHDASLRDDARFKSSNSALFSSKLNEEKYIWIPKKFQFSQKNNTSIQTMMETLDQQCNHKKLSPKKSIKNISFSRMMQSLKSGIKAIIGKCSAEEI